MPLTSPPGLSGIPTSTARIVRSSSASSLALRRRGAGVTPVLADRVGAVESFPVAMFSRRVCASFGRGVGAPVRLTHDAPVNVPRRTSTPDSAGLASGQRWPWEDGLIAGCAAVAIWGKGRIERRDDHGAMGGWIIAVAAVLVLLMLFRRTGSSRRTIVTRRR